MPPTISYKRCDVILVPFPFSDQTSVKQRPSLVISVDAFQERGPDLLIMAVTSQVGSPLKLGEFIIRDWQAAGLLKPSAVKVAITTIEAGLVRRRLGRLSDYDLEQLERNIARPSWFVGSRESSFQLNRGNSGRHGESCA